VGILHEDPTLNSRGAHISMQVEGMNLTTEMSVWKEKIVFPITSALTVPRSLPDFIRESPPHPRHVCQGEVMRSEWNFTQVQA
jgi:hypothetical protein